MKNLLHKFNQIHPVFLTFLIICLNRLGAQLVGGEEQYLLMARHYFDPSFIPGSFHLTEFAGTKLFFHLLVGPILKYTDFEVFVFFARLVNFLLISFPLARLLKHLKFTNLDILIFVQAYIFAAQSFFAHEWMIWNVEPKSVAYIFVIWALYFLIKEKYKETIVFSAIAVHFHYLVGGWFFVVFVLYLLVSRLNIRILLKYILIFLVLILPFTLYLYIGILSNYPEEINGVNLNWIYCYFRLPHHIGIFRSFDYFFDMHFKGVLLTFILLVFCIFYSKFIRSEIIRILNRLNILMFSLVLIFVSVALIDKLYFNCECHFFLKYYPFRLSALSRFLFYAEVILIVKSIWSKSKYTKAFQYFIFVVVVLLSLSRFGKNVRHNVFKQVDISFDEMAEYVRKNTDAKSVFMLVDMNPGSTTYISFMRKAERENFSVLKFVPAGTDKLYYWYQRVMNLNKVRNSIDNLVGLNEEYEVDYVITPKTYNKSFLVPIYQNQSYNLYKTNFDAD